MHGSRQTLSFSLPRFPIASAFSIFAADSSVDLNSLQTEVYQDLPHVPCSRLPQTQAASAPANMARAVPWKQDLLRLGNRHNSFTLFVKLLGKANLHCLPKVLLRRYENCRFR